MIVKPAAEWRVVAAEHHTVGSLIGGYAAPLSAISAICGFIGTSLVLAVIPVAGGLAAAVTRWIVGLVGLYVSALVIELLAPKFASTPNRIQALKLIVFAFTPIWIAGVAFLIPVLSVLVLLAMLYAVYVFYIGLPPVMHTPADLVVPYMAVSVLVVFAIMLVINMVAAALM